MKYGLSVSAALLLLAAPAMAQSVRAGIDAWQEGKPEVAVAMWAPLAAKGDADAAFNLGQAYRLGRGVPIDLGSAQQFLEQAAHKGHVDAATTLGILLFQNGNRTGAIRWLRQAAEAGEPRAMLLYGTALYNGDGTTPDVIKAYAFVSRAAAQGLAAGRATLADLDAAMPLEQRQKGIELAKTMAAAKPGPAPVPSSRPSPPSKIAALPTKVMPTKVMPTKVAPPVAVATNAGGGWRIQLGAFGQRASAETLFARLRGKLGARQAYYVPVGTVTRLQVGPYGSRAAATSACAALAGQACFAVSAR